MVRPGGSTGHAPANGSDPAVVDDGERGSATIVGVGAVVALLAVFTVALQLGAAVITRHRAESAADLAALAAAAHAVSGTQAACAAAGRVTGGMAVRLLSCDLHGWEASVRVEAAPPGLIAPFGAARATARAGPVDFTSAVTDRPR